MADKNKPDPVAAARSAYAAACAAERAKPGRVTARATDEASTALYRALREARR